ncbi:hypothetical protein BASA62_003428 [Batrachochytrium salamandrivorans]|nr:hypothetical protein BASA62_003428 [Batrachochytrium salamandrivorans]
MGGIASILLRSSINLLIRPISTPTLAKVSLIKSQKTKRNSSNPFALKWTAKALPRLSPINTPSHQRSTAFAHYCQPERTNPTSKRAVCPRGINTGKGERRHLALPQRGKEPRDVSLGVLGISSSLILVQECSSKLETKSKRRMALQVHIQRGQFGAAV